MILKSWDLESIVYWILISYMYTCWPPSTDFSSNCKKINFKKGVNIPIVLVISLKKLFSVPANEILFSPYIREAANKNRYFFSSSATYLDVWKSIIKWIKLILTKKNMFTFEEWVIFIFLFVFINLEIFSPLKNSQNSLPSLSGQANTKIRFIFLRLPHPLVKILTPTNHPQYDYVWEAKLYACLPFKYIAFKPILLESALAWI